MERVCELEQTAALIKLSDSLKRTTLEQICMEEDISLNRFSPIEAGEWLEMKIRKRQERLGYLLSSEIIANFNAPSGLCKTWLVMSICAAMTIGGECLNFKAPITSKVVYLDAEMPQIDIQERIKTLAIGMSNTQLELFRENFSEINIDRSGQKLPDLTTELGQKIISHHTKHADVLVIDSFVSVFSETDDTDSSMMKNFTKWLRVMRESGLLIITINHTTKDFKRLGSVVLDTYNDLTIDPSARTKTHENKHLEFIFSSARHLSSKQKETINFNFSVEESGVNFYRVT